ncbi:MAG: ketoacyl-ACP synthase III [Candidatus Omnitrophica bacterium]|nr:ketoacyl-ACP synthase III [Candidatus Omnitrophota bacterium]MDE2010351.1 ketoacyl-ACP synthase III [Candidatus Omnitrophota bacterium]MDE2215438.1 ketoacyl-ACP synthase III [Candidatus Omnitrophota bacterium]MDE2232246.1 ketoacyl-ACP synthase III [Candidatus Omnitrophota bacterium]
MVKVGILGLGRYLPSKKLTNSDLEKMVDTSDEWIRTRTGIKERRIAALHEKTSDLATKAALSALRDAKISAEKIDLIVVATISPDSNFPSMACKVQKAIRAHKAAAFDVSAACSGYLFALTTAKQYIQTGLAKRALVIAAERISGLIDWKNRDTCVLFGDGAGACVLGPVKSGGILADFLQAFGAQGDLMQVIAPEARSPFHPAKAAYTQLPYVQMKGQELFKVAVNSMADAVEKVLKKAKIKKTQVDWIVPHQANDRIISAVANKLGVPKKKIFINIDKYGNMSAASIAVALYEAKKSKKIKKGDKVVLVTFGAGLVSAANLIKW